ncbi:MAG: beta-galactosidase [Opitutaceae bacterium]|nr:beta-galactosidase [Opitutaceae bacterium]
MISILWAGVVAAVHANSIEVKEQAAAVPHDDPYPLIVFESTRLPADCESWQGATLAMVSDAGLTALKVTAAPDSKGSGILFKGQWNFSNYSYLAADVKNLQGTTLTLRILYRGHDFSGEKRYAYDDCTLSPGRVCTIRCPINLIEGYDSDGTPIQFNGPMWWPWGRPVNPQKSPRALDPTTVYEFQLAALPSKTPISYSVKNIRLEESRVHPNTGRHLAPDPVRPRFYPFVDQFGQYMHWEWPGKTHNEAELIASIKQEKQDLEAHPRPANFTRYGGDRDGGRFKATGHFRTQKIDGKWWIIDPEGYKFISWGMNGVRVKDLGTAVAPVNPRLVGPQYDRRRWFAWLPSWDDPAYTAFYKQEPVHFWDRQLGWNFDFHEYNQFRKYGRDYRTQSIDMMCPRLESWGMNTIGSYSVLGGLRGMVRGADLAAKKQVPYTLNIAYSGQSSYIARYLPSSNQDIPDPYDPRFAANLDSACAKLGDSATDPWCLGYFVDTELRWWGPYGWAVPRGVIQAPADQPAKIAFKKILSDNYKAIDALNAAWNMRYASWDDFLSTTTLPTVNDAVQRDHSRFFLELARKYYSMVRAAIKAHAPNKLYLGSRTNTPNARPEVIQAAGEFCDIASYNLYLPPSRLKEFFAGYQSHVGQGAPMLIGEFDFCARDRGMWGVFATMLETPTQAKRAAKTIEYVKVALADPMCVGFHWFSYRDRMLTGKSTTGNNPQAGFLDVCDRPYAEIVAASRAIGENLYPYREKGTWTH